VSLTRRLRIVTPALVVIFATNLLAQSPQIAPPAHLTSEQDHQRTMDLLHITSIRRGADGDTKSQYAANYEETKAEVYPKPPDALLLKSGERVKTPEAWLTQRRPEIIEEFDREIYGRVPKTTPKVKWTVISTTREKNGNVPVLTKKIVGHVESSSYPLITIDIQLTLTTPADAVGPVPIMMELALSPEAMAALAKRFPAMLSTATREATWQQQILARGWGHAVYIPTSVQPDNGEGLTDGVIGLVNKGQPRSLDDWGALRAWAWGASRALDYFETDKSVDARRVGVEGHSRYGKAALVAMAYDQRFAIAYISSSGEAGAKLYRRNFGEQIGNIAGSGEYHWMAGNFLKYDGPLTENDLPVDAHELIALCAPRPVFIGAGATQGDGWVDAKGMFQAAVNAGPVYVLLGKKGLGTAEFPPIETALIAGDIAFRQHSGGHTPAPNWPTFLTFAGRYLQSPLPAAVVSANSSPNAAPEVALTFDDLPSHGSLPPGITRTDVATSIIRALQSRGAPPVFGFVNAKRLQEDPSSMQVLRLWRAAGFPLGSHSFSHMNLGTNSVEAFEADIVADEPTLRDLMGDQDWHWFRYPYLSEGDTYEKHAAVASYLKEHGYRVAEVTLSFSDYGYNEPYVRCTAKNDQKSIDWLKQNYLSRASEDISLGQKAAELVYGRDIRHVMLLHIGIFTSIMLPQLLDLLEQRGFKLVTLEEAEKDPAYASSLDTPSKSSGTLQFMMVAEKDLPPIQHSDDPLEVLDALCR
jgi:peptidoglycan/xylan/chitin deacetylase (PgdA/CDA1 family)